jgi:hypothetical protein
MWVVRVNKDINPVFLETTLQNTCYFPCQPRLYHSISGLKFHPLAPNEPVVVSSIILPCSGAGDVCFLGDSQLHRTDFISVCPYAQQIYQHTAIEPQTRIVYQIKFFLLGHEHPHDKSKFLQHPFFSCSLEVKAQGLSHTHWESIQLLSCKLRSPSNSCIEAHLKTEEQQRPGGSSLS